MSGAGTCSRIWMRLSPSKMPSTGGIGPSTNAPISTRKSSSAFPRTRGGSPWDSNYGCRDGLSLGPVADLLQLPVDYLVGRDAVSTTDVLRDRRAGCVVGGQGGISVQLRQIRGVARRFDNAGQSPRCVHERHRCRGFAGATAEGP